jgi:UDP-glucose 4-epimerase
MTYILVTGGLGFIGSHTIFELLDKQYKIIIIDNLSNSSKNVLDVFKNIIFFQIDVRSNLQLENLFVKYKISAVIHFAALKAVSESITNPLQYYDNNICGTMNLLEIMKKHNCKKIIFSSSMSVYGENIYPVTEESPTGNGLTNPYGKTKYMIEQILSDLYNSDKNWSITILRYFNPIGAHPSGLLGENPNNTPNNLFPYLLKVCVKKLPVLTIFGSDYETKDGTCVRDFIHVVDLAKGHVKALDQIENEQPKLQVYNLGTGKGTSVKELVGIFEKVNNVVINHKYCGRREGDLPIVYANSEKANKELDWKCIYTLEDMCKHGYNYALKNF